MILLIPEILQDKVTYCYKGVKIKENVTLTKKEKEEYEEFRKIAEYAFEHPYE